MLSGQKNPSLILDSMTSASACTRILLPRTQRPSAVVRKTPAHRGHDPEAYGAAEGDLRALKAEIYGCDTGSCGENTVDVGNVSHICTSDLMLCIRRSAKVYKTGNEYNRLNFTGHTRS